MHLSTVGRSTPAWCNTVIRVLHIVVHESTITIIFFLGNKIHSILFLSIVVIICVNLTSNGVIFKRTAVRVSANKFLQRSQNIVMLTSIKHSHPLLHHPSLKYCSVYLLNHTCTCRLPCIKSVKKFSLRSNCMECKRNVV